jgi:amino-acid N-acetyltransferase
MDAITHQETIELIREVFHYSHRFQGKTFVFKVDYPVLNSGFFPQLIKDLSLLHRVGIRCVIVPGARERIEEVLDRYNVRTELSGTLRISSPESLPFIKMAAFDVVNRFMTEFSAHNVMSVMGNWVRARSVGVVDGVDYQNSGQVHKIDTDAMVKVLEQGSIPILPCIGWSSKGKPYNLNSNELALRVAEALQSAKLFFVNELDGLFKPTYKFPPDVVFSTDQRCARLNLEETAAVLAMNMNEQNNLLLQAIGPGKGSLRAGGRKGSHHRRPDRRGGAQRDFFKPWHRYHGLHRPLRADKDYGGRRHPGDPEAHEPPGHQRGSDSPDPRGHPG